MKYLKLFEQVDEWDPFGEEFSHEKTLIPITKETIVRTGDQLYYNDTYFTTIKGIRIVSTPYTEGVIRVINYIFNGGITMTKDRLMKQGFKLKKKI